MKATQNIINEVTNAAKIRNINVESALRMLTLCSLQMYKDLGVESFLDSVEKSEIRREAMKSINGDVFEVSRFTKIRETEKAICIEVPGVHSTIYRTIWVAKSLINNGFAPTWILNK